MDDLPPPTRDDLRDEALAITTTLIEQHHMNARGVRTIVKRALRTGRVRVCEPAVTLRIATLDDLLADLEQCVIEIHNSRIAMGAITKGEKLAIAS